MLGSLRLIVIYIQFSDELSRTPRIIFLIWFILNIYSLVDAPGEEATSQSAVIEGRTSGKSKKRAPWKGKTEFSHQWLLKNLKGHPGTVLLVDFSSNGKFMAATCDGKCQFLGILDVMWLILRLTIPYFKTCSTKVLVWIKQRWFY